MTGLQWYKNVYKFLSSQKSYLIITQSEEQKLSLIDIINSHKGQGIRLKAEYKKFGLCLGRGRRGDAAVVTNEVLKEFCYKNSIIDVDTCKYILPYNAKMFKECRQLKNINVHRNKKSHKNLEYHKQLETKEWKDYRKLVFSSRGKVCEMCGAKTNLQVHHPKYVFGRKAWEYPISEVVVLCRKCHEKVHNIKKKQKVKNKS